MARRVHGFLHTKGGEFVAGEVSKESKTELGGAGLAERRRGLVSGGRRNPSAPPPKIGNGRISGAVEARFLANSASLVVISTSTSCPASAGPCEAPPERRTLRTSEVRLKADTTYK